MGGGEKERNIPRDARVYLAPKLWQAIAEFAHRAGRSVHDQEQFFFEAGVEAGSQQKDFYPTPERNWGKESKSEHHRTNFVLLEQHRELMAERQESQHIKYTSLVRNVISSAVEAAMSLPKSIRYGAQKETITDLLVKKYDRLSRRAS